MDARAALGVGALCKRHHGKLLLGMLCGMVSDQHDLTASLRNSRVKHACVQGQAGSFHEAAASAVAWLAACALPGAPQACCALLPLIWQGMGADSPHGSFLAALGDAASASLGWDAGEAHVQC